MTGQSKQKVIKVYQTRQNEKRDKIIQYIYLNILKSKLRYITQEEFLSQHHNYDTIIWVANGMADGEYNFLYDAIVRTRV